MSRLIERYLKKISEEFDGKPDFGFSSDSPHHPRNLALNRVKYGYVEGSYVVGAGQEDPNVREEEREYLSGLARKAEEDSSEENLVNYAERLAANGYYELAENMLGYLLTQNPSSLLICHFLSRLNLDRGHIQTRKKRAKKMFRIACVLARNGLRFEHGEHKSGLLEDCIDSLSRLEKFRFRNRLCNRL